MSGLNVQSNGGSLQQSTLSTIQTLASSILPAQGNVFFVNPRTGADTNDGSQGAPLKTLAQALALATANQNDIVYLEAAGNSAAATTDYQSSTLNWNKDGVHLIGVNAGPLYSQRSRIAFQAGYTGTGELFTLSANGCIIAGIEMFMGVASVNPVGCMSITGQRNHLFRCHIAGMGNAANDISGAYSLQLKGAEENLIEDCTIGQDTVQLGAGTSNSVLLFTNNAPANTRNWFRNCRFMLDTSSATVCLFARGGGAGNLDRETIFEDCLFINAIASGSTTLTHAMAIVTGGGVVILTGAKTGLFGASGWNSNASVIYATGGGQPSASTYGLATAQTS